MRIDQQTLEHYLKFDTWTAKEASLIINGYHPDAMSGQGINVRARIDQIPEEFHDTIRTLEIFLRTDWGAYGYQFYRRSSGQLPPIAFLTVALDKQTPFDEVVLDNVEEWWGNQRAAREEEEETYNEPSLKASERESLYKIIAGLAMGGYRYEPGKRNLALTTMHKNIESAGITIDIDTLSKWLKAACKILPPANRS